MTLNVWWIFSKRQELNSAHILSLPGFQAFYLGLYREHEEE